MSEPHMQFREEPMPAAIVLPARERQDRPVRAAPPPARIGAAHAALKRIVGRGRQVFLPTLDATLAVYPAAAEPPGAWPDALTLCGPDGAIEIEEGVRLLRVLGGIDITAGDLDDANRAWLLAAALGGLAGTPFASCDRIERTAPSLPRDAQVLRLALRSGRHTVSMRMRADAATFTALLERSDWSPLLQPWSAYATLPIPIDVRLGSHVLPAGRLRTLAVGDILLPASVFFDVAGEGWIPAGRRRLRVRHAAPGALTVLDVSRPAAARERRGTDGGTDARRARANLSKGMEMDELHDEDEAQRDEDDDGEANDGTHDGLRGAAGGNGADDADDADAIGIPLHFLLGRARISLGELRALTAGSIILFDGGSPQSVAIVSSGRVLGRGEAVDVDGRLGIRITQWGYEGE